MTKALVNKILPFSSVDGPGNRTVIFLQGCNFNCLYCHNPETISKSSPKAVVMTVSEVMMAIDRVRPFISGITVSGGECTLQKEFLIELFEEVHKLKLTAFVDTNGSIDFSNEEKLTNSLDMVMLDIKSFDEEEHRMLTGMSNNLILKNAEYLARLDKLYEIRTVFVPGLLDNRRNVLDVSRLIAGLNPNIRYKLIKFRPLGVLGDMKKVPAPSNELMEDLKKSAEEMGCRNVIVV
ncbi:MAG: radical SAM protein [Clostridia bacterium]